MTPPRLRTLILAPAELRHMPLLARALSGIDWIVGGVASDHPLVKEWAVSTFTMCSVDRDGVEAVVALWDGKDAATGREIEAARAAGLRVHIHKISLQDNAECVLYALRANGFTFRSRDGKLTVEPMSQLTPEQLATVKAHRQEFLAILRDEAEWERRAEELAKLAPDFPEDCHARLVLAMILRWWDEQGNVIHEAVAEADGVNKLLEQGKKT